MSLRKLPNEIISTITRDLGIEDIFHLALSCRQFRGLIYDNTIAKHALEANAPAAFEVIEAQSSRDYARSLRRLVKRRKAVSSASPFQAAIVAVAETFMYRNGVLCYILDRKLRILDLHQSSTKEICVDIRDLLDQCITESLGTRKYKFHLVHFSNGIVTCRYTHAKPDVEHWLVIFHVRDRWAVSHRLDSTYKLFVRNNQDYLYYGTHSEFGDDGFRRWVLRGYSFGSGHWFDQKVFLGDLVGSDIGSQVAFEIFDGFLYGVANQTAFEVEGTEWPSFYHCFRFPLDNPRPEKRELPDRDSLWRRAHGEGPVDDRWTFLCLQRDHFGGLQILESRKEWLGGSSKGRRTLYRKPLVFSSPLRNSPLTPPETPGTTSVSASSSANWIPQPGLLPLTFPQTANRQKGAHTADFKTARHWDPQDVHPGDDPAPTQLITLSQSFIRLYHHSSSAFVDMIDLSDQSDPTTQQVQLRVTSRTPQAWETWTRAPLTDEHVPTLDCDQEMDRIFRPSTFRYWPDQAQTEQFGPEISYEIDKVLNPPAHTGNLSGTWDDRSLLYATGGGRGGLRAIVFVGFDPGIRLRGMKTRVKTELGDVVWKADDLHGPQAALMTAAGEVGMTGRGEERDDIAWEEYCQQLEEKAMDSRCKRKYVGEDNCPVTVAPGPSTKPPKATWQVKSSWARVEDAMFLDIQRGFDFTR